MLRRLLSRRYFADTSIKNVSTITFDTVKFVKEPSEDVLLEVPDVKYYLFGGNNEVNPYKDVPMHAPVNIDLGVPKIVEPKMRFSKLENGLRVASIDRQGLTAQLSLVVNAGTRFEEPSELGVCDMVRMMSFMSTAHLSYLRTLKTVEAIGANAYCQVNREMISYSMEVLRDYLPIATTLLVGNVLFPRFLDWEINFVKEKWKKEGFVWGGGILDKDQIIDDLLHQVAYHNNTLGHSVWATEKSFDYFTAETIRAFMLKHFSMQRSIFVGVNVNHDDLCKWLMRSFVDYNPIPHVARKGDSDLPVSYTGGYVIKESADALGQVHVAIAFESKGWDSQDLLPAAVLQTLLGGGGSYSTGGPGKGMHSRLYLNVLNSNYFVDHCQAFNSMHSDSGLFGISLSGQSREVSRLINVASEEIGLFGAFSDGELKRAKNLLKQNIFMASENGKLVNEDVSSQLLTSSNQFRSSRDISALIDAVTETDLIDFSKRLLSSAPTFVSFGDTRHTPHISKVYEMLGQAKQRVVK